MHKTLSLVMPAIIKKPQEAVWKSRKKEKYIGVVDDIRGRYTRIVHPFLAGIITFFGKGNLVFSSVSLSVCLFVCL